MKHKLFQILVETANSLKQQEIIPADATVNVQLDNTKDKSHGDFATNLAMTLAKQAGVSPRELAAKIVENLPANDAISKVEIAGPGFINFFVQDSAKFEILAKVLAEKANFGDSDVGGGKMTLIEFVSANPTGPLHVGHGRGAAYGASLANLMSKAGYRVRREYYVNDAGRQMDILAVSVFLRYLELCGEEFVFPSNGYRGDYVIEIAQNIMDARAKTLQRSAADMFANVTPDEADGGDKELHIDDLISNMKNLLGEQLYETVFNIALKMMLADIEQDLAEFGVTFDNWYSERSLMKTGLVDAAIEKLQAAGHLYQKDGATWFKTTEFGDEKDRVVVRENGVKTYFASDIAYHYDKLNREYERLIDIWGADHHGYIARVKAGMQAMDTHPEALEVNLVQFAILYRGAERVPMSTRAGEFVTLRQLRAEVGNDAARYFYVSRKAEQHMDFDLELAKSKSNENPVYYIQYAHARICSVLAQAAEKGMAYDQAAGLANLDKLELEIEADLASLIAQFPELIDRAALAREPHQIAYYLKDLAQALHSYYNSSQFIVEDEATRNARFVLISAVKQVLQNGLSLLGVSAPEQM